MDAVKQANSIGDLLNILTTLHAKISFSRNVPIYPAQTVHMALSSSELVYGSKSLYGEEEAFLVHFYYAPPSAPYSSLPLMSSPKRSEDNCCSSEIFIPCIEHRLPAKRIFEAHNTLCFGWEDKPPRSLLSLGEKWLFSTSSNRKGFNQSSVMSKKATIISLQNLSFCFATSVGKIKVMDR